MQYLWNAVVDCGNGECQQNTFVDSFRLDSFWNILELYTVVYCHLYLFICWFNLIQLSLFHSARWFNKKQALAIVLHSHRFTVELCSNYGSGYFCFCLLYHLFYHLQTYIYTYIYTHTYILIYIFIHPYIHMHIHIRTYTYTSTYILYIHTHAYIHTSINICIHT